MRPLSPVGGRRQTEHDMALKMGRVHVHLETGRNSLFLSPGFVRHIVDWRPTNRRHRSALAMAL